MTGGARPPRRRIGVARLLLASFAAALTLSGAECALRLAPDLVPEDVRYLAAHRRQPVVATHPVLTVHLPPQPGTTALGAADTTFRDDGVDGDPWAVAVGDSFTFGWAVDSDESWPEVLERSLGRDVANLGVPGFSSLQNLVMLERYGLPLGPEVVLFEVFSNDFRNNVDSLGADDRARRIAARRREHRAAASVPGGFAFLDAETWSASAWVAPLEDGPAPAEVGTGVDWGGGGGLALGFLFRFASPPSGVARLVRLESALGDVVVRIDGVRRLVASIGEPEPRVVTSGRALEPGEWHRVVLSVEVGRGLELFVDDDPAWRRPWGPAGQGRPDRPAPGRSPPLEAPELGEVVRVTCFDGALSPVGVRRLGREEGSAAEGPRGTMVADVGRAGWRFAIAEDGRPALLVRHGERVAEVRGDRPVPAEGWTHVGVTVRERRAVTFVVDGESSPVRALQRAVLEPRRSRALVLGGAAGEGRFRGRLWRPRMHVGPLDASDLRALAAEPGRDPPALSTPLGGLWIVDPVVRGFLADGSGRGNTGELGAVEPVPGPGGLALAFAGHAEIPILEWRPGAPARDPAARRVERTSLLREIVERARGRGRYGAPLDEARFLRVSDRSVRQALRRSVLEGPHFHPDSSDLAIRDGLDLALRALDRAAALCADRSVRLVVPVFPFKESVHRHLVPGGLDEGTVPEWALDRVVAHCRARGIECVDLRPALERHARRGEQLYFTTDVHWNARGNRVVAEVLAEVLR